MKFLNTFVLICSLVLSGYGQGGHLIMEGLSLEQVDDGSLFYKTFSGKTNLELDASYVKRVNLETGAGQVELRQSNNSKLSVEATIFLSAKNVEKAYETIDKDLSLALTKEGDEVFLLSLFDYDSENGNDDFDLLKSPMRKVDLIVWVPSSKNIKWNDRSGDIEIRNIENNLDLNDASGGIQIEGLIGNVTLVDHSGEIYMERINSNQNGKYQIDITDYSGEITLRDVVGDTEVNDTSGEIEITGLTGDLTVTDASGEIDIRQVTGYVIIDDTSGGISVRDLKGSVEVSDASGGIYVNEVTENVHVRNDGSGGVTVKNVGGKVTGKIN